MTDARAGDEAYDRLHGLDGHTQAVRPIADLEVVIGLLPDCDHPTSRGVCPRCIADAVVASEWLDAQKAKWRAEVLRAVDTDAMAEAWGHDATWFTTGRKVADLVRCWLDEAADDMELTAAKDAANAQHDALAAAILAVADQYERQAPTIAARLRHIAGGAVASQDAAKIARVEALLDATIGTTVRVKQIRQALDGDTP